MEDDVVRIALRQLAFGSIGLTHTMMLLANGHLDQEALHAAAFQATEVLARLRAGSYDAGLTTLALALSALTQECEAAEAAAAEEGAG